jgi:prepilin-type N-terminal cleavage/methylation domain-containing protein/prepilin-type processing-associated H-X9-DG protein
MSARSSERGFTLLELVVSMVLVTVLLAVLLPAMASARRDSRREECADNQRRLGEAWAVYAEDHAGSFPYVPARPSWHYGGVRFSIVDGSPFLDMKRPLTPYVGGGRGKPAVEVFRCPADKGITGETRGVGTADRTAYEANGTSYRVNSHLVDARLAGLEGEHRGLRRDEIFTVPSRLVVMGDPIWYEIWAQTGRDAAWHGDPDKGNLLFLDGSVRYMTIQPQDEVGPVVYEPKLIYEVDLPIYEGIEAGDGSEQD